MKKSLLFILILLGTVSLHAQEHKHHKITIDVEMDDVTIIQPTLLDTLTCSGYLTLILEPAVGGGGPIAYQWQQSEDDITWENAPNSSTEQNYVISGLIANTYYRRIATNSICTITSNAALVTYIRPPRPEFAKYNLGADPTKTDPKKQMEYLATQTEPLDATIFGGFYQWGRKDLPYAVNSGVTPHLRYIGSSQNTAAWSSSMTYDGDGQVVGQNANFVYSTTNPFDWRGSGTATGPTVPGQWNALWGNSEAINTPTPGTGAVLHTDRNYYQEPVKTVNDPCPSGYRIPTQNDWELMCNYDCDPTIPIGGVYFYSTYIYKTNGGLTWVPVRCGGGDCIASSTSWLYNTPGGYAIYETPVWEVSPVVMGGSLLDAGAPQPLLFLPAAGYRHGTGGVVDAMGWGALYWSSSICDTMAYCLSFSEYSGYVGSNSYMNRAQGVSIRCVKCAVGEDCYVPEP